MKTIAEILAENMRALRKKLHLTQAELAERTGLSTTTIQQIERLEAWVGKDTIAKLATGLETSEIELFRAPQVADPLLDRFLSLWSGLDQSQRQIVANLAQSLVDAEIARKLANTVAQNKKSGS